MEASVDILGKARQLETRIARIVDRVAEQWAQSGGRGPLEVFHAIVEAVGDRLEPAGRGRHVFPFNRIGISVAAGSADARARFAAILDGDPSLHEVIAARLREAGCDASDLQVQTRYVAAPAADWPRPEFHVEFDRGAAVDVPPPLDRSALDVALTIVAGAADKSFYAFPPSSNGFGTAGAVLCIAIGRGAEVRDSRNRLIRTNHVAFSDGEDAIAQTVSRRHAHIDWADDSAEYRLVDDRSAHGTSIVRDGRTIAVPPGARGIRVRSGDELVLGEARIRVRIAAR